MNRFTVTWLQGAQDHLARIWMDRPDKKALTEATHVIDQILANNPANAGQHLAEGLRALYVPPLHVLFSVRELDCLVEVASVRADPIQVEEGNGQSAP